MHVSLVFEFREELLRLLPVKHVLRERRVGRQADKRAALQGHVAAAPHQVTLHDADTVRHRESLMPLEVGIYVLVGLKQVGSHRTSYRYHPQQARAGREDPLAPAFLHVLLEELDELPVVGHTMHVGLIPADQEGAKPVLLYPVDHPLPHQGSGKQVFQ